MFCKTVSAPMFLEVVHLFWSLSCTFSFSLLPFSFLLSSFFCLIYSFKLSFWETKVTFCNILMLIGDNWYIYYFVDMHPIFFVVLATTCSAFYFALWRRGSLFCLSLLSACRRNWFCATFCSQVHLVRATFCSQAFQNVSCAAFYSQAQERFFFFEKIHLAIVMY